MFGNDDDETTTGGWVRLFCANPECSPTAHDLVHNNANDYIIEHWLVSYVNAHGYTTIHN
jgi:hypothetical protein